MTDEEKLAAVTAKLTGVRYEVRPYLWEGEFIIWDLIENRREGDRVYKFRRDAQYEAYLLNDGCPF